MATQLGRYQLHRPIGRGGMAEVWLASRRGAGGIEKRVVIKRILRERVKDPRFLDLFVREAEISMSLSHKNIVPIFDFGRAGDELFLVMDYMDGPNLAMALSAAKKHGALPSHVLISHIIFEGCQALAYAHDYKDETGRPQRIAHRDVTPGNFLLTFSGEVKLGDFGLAAATIGLVEGDGRTQGTPGYMAPEQALGEVVGPGADIYSLGLILYEVLQGQRVRKGEQQEQVRAAKEALAPLPDGIPDALKAICEKACQLRVDERYQSAQAMAADIDAYLVQARAQEQSDRRPMPQQLSDWLSELFPDGLVTKSLEGMAVQGSALTFLDNGVEDLLEDAGGDNTMRSMADTVVESPDAGEDKSDELPPDPAPEPQGESAQDPGSGHRSVAALIALVALLSTLGVGAYYMMAHKSDAAPTGANSPDASLSHDAGRADGLEPRVAIDAALVLPDAAAPAPIPADAATNQGAVQPRQARPDAASAAMGLLRVSTSPWATVVVKGRNESCDETPCTLELPYGTYQLLLENPVAGLKKQVTVTIEGESSLHQVLQAVQP